MMMRLSAEHRAKISAAKRGKPLSSQHRAHLSQAHLGRRLQVCWHCGLRTYKWEEIEEADGSFAERYECMDTAGCERRIRVMWGRVCSDTR